MYTGRYLEFPAPPGAGTPVNTICYTRDQQCHVFMSCFQDVQYGDIDHFKDNTDLTWDPVRFAGLPQYFDDLRSQGIRTIIILVGEVAFRGGGGGGAHITRDTNVKGNNSMN